MRTALLFSCAGCGRRWWIWLGEAYVPYHVCPEGQEPAVSHLKVEIPDDPHASGDKRS